MCQWIRTFLSPLYAYIENKPARKKNWGAIVRFELAICEVFINGPPFLTPSTFFGRRLKQKSILTRARALEPSGKGVIGWNSGVGVGGILVINRIACGYLAL